MLNLDLFYRDIQQNALSDREMLYIAERLAREYFKDKTDKAGKPYIEHLFFVASQMPTDELKTIAWLHDIVEDTPVTTEQLQEFFTPNVINAVQAITKKENESYSEYIKRIKANTLATQVKIADLKHNMDLNRLATITAQDLARVAKYLKALKILLDLDKG